MKTQSLLVVVWGMLPLFGGVLPVQAQLAPSDRPEWIAQPKSGDLMHLKPHLDLIYGRGSFVPFFQYSRCDEGDPATYPASSYICFPGFGADDKPGEGLTLLADGTLKGESSIADQTDNAKLHVSSTLKINGTLNGFVDMKTGRLSFKAKTIRDDTTVESNRNHRTTEIYTYEGTGAYSRVKPEESVWKGQSYIQEDKPGRQQYMGHLKFTWSEESSWAGPDVIVQGKVIVKGTDSSKRTATFNMPFLLSVFGEEVQNEKLPIIFIPGVAGSALSDGGATLLRKNHVSEALWPLAPLGSRVNLGLKLDGRSRVVERLDGGEWEIFANGVVRNVAYYEPGYDPLLKALKELGFREEQAEDRDILGNYTENSRSRIRCFPFPYDWRLDNTLHMLDLDKKVDAVLEVTHAPKVILLTHSMGGLIAKAYINSIGAHKVDTLITISMPFYGAPKVSQGMVNGYNFANRAANPNLMKVLIQNWPAAYQLLPRKPFITNALTAQALSLEDSSLFRYKGFKNVDEKWVFTDDYQPTPDTVWSYNTQLVAQANAFHRMLVDSGTGQPKPLPAGIKHYAIIGYGVKTLSGYSMRDAKPDEEFIELSGRKVVLEPQFDDGDGTVPLWSLDAAGATVQYFVPYYTKEQSSDHLGLTANPTTHLILKDILQLKTPPGPTLYRRPPKTGPLKEMDDDKKLDFTMPGKYYYEPFKDLQ